jgi:subfamily B ATP-binding cassette protein MsbA
VARLSPYLLCYRSLFLAVVLLGAISAAASKAALPLVEPVVDVIFRGETLGDFGLEAVPLLGGLLDRTYDLFCARLLRAEPGSVPSDDAKLALLAVVAILGVGISLVGAGAQYFFATLSRRLGLRMIVDLRRDLCERLLRVPLRYHGKRRLGDILSRLTNDIQVSLRAFTLLFDDVVQEPFMILASLGLMLTVSPAATLAFLAILPLVAIPVVLFGRRVRRGSRRSLAALGDATDTLAQQLAGIRVVKAFGAEDREVEEFDLANRRFLRRTMSMVRAKAATESFLLLLTGAGTAALVAALGWFQIRQGAFDSPGEVVLFLVPLGTLYAHTKRLSRAYTTVMESLGATRRLLDVLDLAPEPPDLPGAVVVRGVSRGIEVRDLRFGYDSAEVLCGLSFSAPAGKTVAIVGPSGAGKSTLFDLLAGFHEPTGGSILVDGVDLRRVSRKAWRSRLAIVSQDPFVFHTTIRENILYGKPDATEEDLRTAANAAHLAEFVASLPEGFETVVGEQGSRLSGGELQRITIARALLRDPAVLLLDEATSSLDAASESAVQAALDNLRAGRTTFVIAHRLSTVRNADLIVVLDRGRIVETGTHAELLGKGGLYRSLYDRQFEDVPAADGAQ